MTYDSGNYEAATAKAVEHVRLRRSARRAGQAPRAPRTRCSSASASPPSPRCAAWRRRRILSALKYVAGGWEHATVRILPTGKVEVVTGTSPHGQGHVTAWSQIAADQLGVDARRHHRRARRHRHVAVRHGHLRLALARGRRDGGRRRPPSGSWRRPRLIAAHMLEADPADLEFKDGVFGVKGSPGSTKTIQEVAFEAFTSHDLPDGVEPTLQAELDRRPARPSRSRTAPTCARSRSTPRPAMTKIRKYVCVDDIGNVVNPMIVEGQVHGGIAQGIAQALYEEAVYDDDGNLVTGSLVDYLVPARARPAVTSRPTAPSHAVDHEPAGGQGRRRGRHDRLDAGRGQRRSIDALPAVRRATTSRWRCTPERVWRAIQDAGSEGGDRAAAGHGRLRRGQPPSRRREARHDPGAVRLRAGRFGRRGGRRPAPSAATTPRCWPAASRLIPLLRLRLAYPEVRGRRSAGSRRCGASARTGTTWSSAR